MFSCVSCLNTCRVYFQNRVNMSAIHPSLHLKISLAAILSAVSPAAVSYFTVISAYRRLEQNVYWSSLFSNMQSYPLHFYRVEHNSIYSKFLVCVRACVCVCMHASVRYLQKFNLEFSYFEEICGQDFFFFTFSTVGPMESLDPTIGQKNFSAPPNTKSRLCVCVCVSSQSLWSAYVC